MRDGIFKGDISWVTINDRSITSDEDLSGMRGDRYAQKFWVIRISGAKDRRESALRALICLL